MKVLVIGGGGREHALMWKLAQSPRVTELVAAPGNAGMARIGRCLDVELNPVALLELAERERVDLTLIGPEAPLVAGVVDAFEAAGRAVFGPNRAAARLEGSKQFAKDFMVRHGIPTAHHATFSDTLLALETLERTPLPIVIKDSDLAAGKGVTVATSKAEARQAARNILEAPEGGRIVIEEFLAGDELSLLLFTDGESARPMLLAQDYKQAFDGDEGPMTGGMGAVAPAPLLDEAELAAAMENIVEPTLRGLREEGMRYRGVLYLGLMKTATGLKVLEYNVRFGDPETQVVLPLLQTDLLEVCEAVIGGRLAELTLSWADAAAACVVLAAPGYPGAYAKGIPLSIPTDLTENVTVFHAGTRRVGERLLSSGGRVLGVTALAESLEAAVRGAYAAASRIDFPGVHYRRDIGGRLRLGTRPRWPR